MAIQILESWDDGADASRMGPKNYVVDSAYGLHGDGIRLGDTPGGYFYPPIDGSATAIFGFAIYIQTPGAGDKTIGTVGTSVELSYDSSNQRLHASIRNGVASYVDVYTPINSMKVSRWHYIEVKFLTSTSSAGTWQMGIDGTYTSETTGIDYYFAYDTTRIGWSTSTYVTDFYVDDLYVADTTGGVNDDFLGPIAVTAKLPDGNGNWSDLVGQDADSTDNYLNVDEATPDAGTTYNESGTEGDKDTYTFEDITGTPTVLGVAATMYARRTETGAKYVRAVARVGSTDYVGTTQGLAEGYGVVEEYWDENPATSTAWTYTTFNGAEFGPEVRD